MLSVFGVAIYIHKYILWCFFLLYRFILCKVCFEIPFETSNLRESDQMSLNEMECIYITKNVIYIRREKKRYTPVKKCHLS